MAVKPFRTAIRIDILNTAGDDVENTVDFLELEILQSSVFPIDDVTVKRAQNGKPTLFLTSDAWHILKINFRVHGQTTTAKFTTIRNSLRLGKVLRVYPRFMADESYYVECFADPKQFILISSMSGQDMANETVLVEFIETNNQYITMDEEFFL